MQARVALLALLVVLAGCSGTTGEDPTTPGSTAATTAAETPGTADVPADETLAPGVTGAGVENATALVVAHVDALNDTGWRHRYEYVGTTRPSDVESSTTNVSKRVAVTAGMDGFRVVRADRQTRRHLSTNTSTTRGYDEWNNGSLALVQVEANDRTFYRPGRQYDAGNRTRRTNRLTDRGFLVEYLAAGEYAVTEVDRSGDGARVVLEADGVADAGLNVTDFDARAVLDGSGRIHEFSVTAAGTRNGTDTTVEARYRLVRTGVERLDRPPWFDAALAATNATASGE